MSTGRALARPVGTSSWRRAAVIIVVRRRERRVVDELVEPQVATPPTADHGPFMNRPAHDVASPSASPLMPLRIGEPQRLEERTSSLLAGEPQRRPEHGMATGIPRAGLGERNFPEWPDAVEAGALVFEARALGLGRGLRDWSTNGSPTRTATSHPTERLPDSMSPRFLVVDDQPDVGTLAQDISRPRGTPWCTRLIRWRPSDWRGVGRTISPCSWSTRDALMDAGSSPSASSP